MKKKIFGEIELVVVKFSTQDVIKTSDMFYGEEDLLPGGNAFDDMLGGGN